MNLNLELQQQPSRQCKGALKLARHSGLCVNTCRRFILGKCIKSTSLAILEPLAARLGITYGKPVL